jgi:DNA helicase-2/ATP-dependent DNA helicase PcrA
MAVTFTNKAAREMRERLHQLLGSSVEKLTLGTFHAICSRILHQEASHIGLSPKFVIYDDEDSLSLIKRSLLELNIDPERYSPKALQSLIGAAKSQLLTPDLYAQHTRSYFEEIASRTYQRYQQLLSQNNALDFDDLIMRLVLLFNGQPEILSKYQRHYLHLNIDEFQDTNIAQYELAKQIGGKYHNICVVGDPDQSIYSWRSADLRNILSFEKDYPDTRVILLEQNYRSTKIILEAAQHVISPNQQRKEKNLWTENEVGASLTITETYSEQEEAQFVINEVDRLVDDGIASPGDCAVMYRTNAQSRAIEEAFIRYGIPYKLVGGTRFYQRREIKDMIAYLRLIHNPDDDVSLTRIINIPPRGIGQQTMGKISQWARVQNLSLYRALQIITAESGEVSAKPTVNSRSSHAIASFSKLINELIAKSGELNVVDLLDEVLAHTGYRQYILEKGEGEERWDNILEMRTAAGEYHELQPAESLSSFLEGATLVSDVDDLDENLNTVTLITLHQGKGLEFPVVFITGMEEGIFPHRKSFDDPAQMEEERRLCYVGMTRAEKLLYLIRAFRRNLMGNSTVNPPSRFLKDIPTHLANFVSPFEKEKSPVATSHIPQHTPSIVKAGDHVHHTIFGDGVVVNCFPTTDDNEVTVAFGKEVGIKKLLLSIAPMEVRVSDQSPRSFTDS